MTREGRRDSRVVSEVCIRSRERCRDGIKNVSTGFPAPPSTCRLHIVRRAFGPYRREGRVTVLFGTLGWRPQSLIPSVKSTEGLERVVFYHSAHEKSRAARAKVMEYCNTLGVPAAAVELSDAFNLFQIAERIRGDVLRSRKGGTPIRFNIAGGTRLMSSAALLVCILEGIPTTYVHDDTF